MFPDKPRATTAGAACFPARRQHTNATTDTWTSQGRENTTRGGAMPELLDEPTLSLRDVLDLVRLTRDTHPRDPLRALEDLLLDLGARVEEWTG